jgi:hypothetical protein
MMFDTALTPGPGAVEGMRVLGMHTDQPALVIFFDPESLAITVPGGPATWPEFVRFLRQLRDGAEEMADSSRAVEALLTAFMHPFLVHPHRQARIHNGRKILDITYVNSDQSGFFKWLSNNYAAANVVVECKNYSKDLGNPEYDQLAGRFSPPRGRYGFLVFRDCANKDKLWRTTA